MSHLGMRIDTIDLHKKKYISEKLFQVKIFISLHLFVFTTLHYYSPEKHENS
jgi:hypothetical protein